MAVIKYDKTPKIRLPSFTGEWAVKLLSEVSDFRNGHAHEQVISENGKYVVVNSKFISTGGVVRKHCNSIISPLFKEEIVMVMSDVPNGRALAKCYFIEEDGLYTLNQRICAIRAVKANSKFLFYRFNRNRYFLKFDSGVGQTNLRKDEVLQCPIAVPESRDEQQKIADFLTAVDARIGQLSKKKTLLVDYKKGVMQQLFTQAIRLKDEDGSEYPDWEEKKLGEITSWASGGTPSKDQPLFWGGSFPWISAISMHGRYYKESPLTLTSAGVKSGSKIAKKGTLLLLVRGSMLWNRIPVGITICDVAFNQDVKALVPTSEVQVEFLLQWFIASEHMLLHKVVGTGIGAGKLDTDEMKDLKLNLPSIEEQAKITIFLSAIDRKIEIVSKQTDETKILKKGLLQQMFV